MFYKQLLKEGGVGGHMSHPYENTELSFSELKKMFNIASKGFPGLKVTEKLDGQNIFISFDPDRQEALVTRNKKHISLGGINKEALVAALTTDRPVEKRTPANVVDAYRDAISNFEDIAKTVPENFFIHESGGKIFYNAEVMDPRSPNVINYDTQILAIHRVGHILIRDGVAIELESSEAETYAVQLEETLSEYQTGTDIPSVKINALINFKDFIEKKDAYKRVNANIDSILRDVGMSDGDTIGSYLQKRGFNIIKYKLADLNLSDEALQSMSEAVYFFSTEGGKLPRIRTEIARVLSEIPEHRSQEREICYKILRDRKALRELSSRISSPLIMVVHKFAVEILENFASAYVAQSGVVVNKLKKNIQQKTKDIKNLANDGDLSVLKAGIDKLTGGESTPEEILSDAGIAAAISNISTAVEGLVFDFEGKTYKLTGNFAPINQIMGLGRYSRSTVKEEIIEEEEEEEELQFTRKIAVFPGKFKPPHKGHLHMVQEVINKGADLVVVMVSPITKDDITAENSIDVWNLYISRSNIPKEKVIVIRSPYNSPVMASYAIMDEQLPALKIYNIPKAGDLIIPVASTKPDDRGISDIERFAKYSKYQPKIKGVKPADVRNWAINPDFDCEGAYCASDFRNDLNSSQDIERYIPDSINPDEVKQLLGFFSSEEEEMKEKETSPSPVSLAEGLILLIEEVLKEGDWQPIARKRTRRGHSFYLDQGRKDLIKHGAPFNMPRDKNKSNAFLAKESWSAGSYDTSGWQGAKYRNISSFDQEEEESDIPWDFEGTEEEWYEYLAAKKEGEAEYAADMEDIDEISSMAGGNVQGFSNPIGSREKKLKKRRSRETN